MKSISNSSFILMGLISAFLLGCANDRATPKSSTIVLRNNAPALVTVKTAGNSQPLASADSVSFAGTVGQVFPIEIKLEFFAGIEIWSLSPTFTPTRQVLHFNVNSGFFFLRIVNNSSTYYSSVHVFNMDGTIRLASIYPNDTTDVAYFHSAGLIQITVGQEPSNPNGKIFREGIDFTLPNTENQILTLVID